MAIFVAIVDRGSLTAAAAEHGISATMAGNHLQALEARLRVRLLNRTTRRQSLTEFGRTYYERCSEILGLVSDTEARAMETRIAPRGRLRISAPVSFGAESLMPVLADYLARYPEVEVDVALSDRVVDLVEEGYEVAIRTARTPDAGLVSHPLQPYRMMICASPDYIERRGMPRQPQDLREHDCLAFSYAGTTWRMTGADGAVSLQIQARVQVNNGQALRVAALNGLGIIMQPEALLADDVSGGRLVRLMPECTLPSRPMYLVHLPDRHISPKLRSFIDFAIERFGA